MQDQVVTPQKCCPYKESVHCLDDMQFMKYERFSSQIRKKHLNKNRKVSQISTFQLDFQIAKTNTDGITQRHVSLSTVPITKSYQANINRKGRFVPQR